jgi:pimeloyl-ACP methyl ester carboxylesterase
MARSRDEAWQAAYANIQRYFPGAWKPEYEQYVRILYAPTLSGDWPRMAMVRSICQQITFLDPVVDDWAHIKVKTLVLGGELDGQNFPTLAKHIADTIPGAELVIIPKVGHVPHIQVPEIFNRELLKFLESDSSLSH